jgi:hypothetical protein
MLILGLILFKTTTALPAVRIYVYPTPPIVSTAAPGEKFTIQIQIEDAPSTYTFLFALKWNSTILNCTNVSEGPFMKVGGRKTYLYGNELIDNDAGNLTALGGLLGEPAEAQVKGSGILAFCTFLVKESGETTLDLFKSELCDYYKRLTYPEETDGLFVYPVAALEVPKIVDGSKIAGKNVTVDVCTINIQELKGFEFKLNYNTTVLEAQKVDLKPFSQPNINSTYINATAGYVYANITGYGTAGPVSGNRTLVSITFQVKQNRGASILNLGDVKVIALGHVGWLSSYFTNVVHDVAVTITNVSPATEVTVGNPVEITVSAKNAAWATQNETFRVEVRAGREVVDSISVENLAPGNSNQSTLAWNTTALVIDKPVSYEIKAETDVIEEIISNVLVEEENTTDNKYTYGSILVKPAGGILSFPIEYIVVIVVVAIVIVVALVYLARRRKHT